MDAETRSALRDVIAYNWQDEERDYEENDGEGSPEHVFRKLRHLDHWLSAQEQPCEMDDCGNAASPCWCGNAHCTDHPHVTVPRAGDPLTREWRVHGNATGDGSYAVSQLTEDRGLVPVLAGLERWQALAIVAVLDPPFSD